MANDDMGHMVYIDGVAANDADVLRFKEQTYKGSWKRAGGRSAWFMMRRNMDRLITMLAPPVSPGHGFNLQNVADTIEAIDTAVIAGDDALLGVKFPGSKIATVEMLRFLRDSFTAEDVFAKIEQDPSGADGTVLASLRDLRRYLLLIEAEMMARGVVNFEEVPVVVDDEYRRPKTDIYRMIADEKGLTREEVKHRIHELFYSNPPPHPLGQRLDEKPALNGGYAAEQAARHRAEVIADGGSQHAIESNLEFTTLRPWQIDKTGYDLLKQRVGPVADLFYIQRASGIFQLVPIVGSTHCPRELCTAYSYADQQRWVLKRGSVPDDLQDNFPRLQMEKNTVEYEQGDKDFQFMYKFHESPQKWILRPEFADWAREA